MTDPATFGHPDPSGSAEPAGQVDLPADLLEILVCPSCHASLAVDHDRSELVCTGVECGLAYPVRNQIPVLLIDAARSPRAEAERARLAQQAAEPAGPDAAGEPPSVGPAAGTVREQA